MNDLLNLLNLIVIETDKGKLKGWTECSYELSQESTSQSASLSMFCDSIPLSPVYPYLCEGKEVKFIVNGEVIITGEIEKREGEISQEGYKLNITIKSATEKGKKGTAKFRKGQGKDVELKDIISEIAKNAGIKVKFGKMPDSKKRVYNCLGVNSAERELRLLCLHNGLHMFANQNGEWQIEEENEEKRGDNLIIGNNIVEANIGQGEENKSSKVKAVGTKAYDKDVYRDDTLTSPQSQKMKSKDNGEQVFFVDGDSTEKDLERVSRYLANRKSAASNEGTIKVFPILQSNGKPWVSGLTCYVQVPSESLFDDMLIKSVSCRVSKEELSATLTIAPKKSMSDSNKSGAASARGKIEMKQRGINLDYESYPFPWNDVLDNKGLS